MYIYIYMYIYMYIYYLEWISVILLEVEVRAKPEISLYIQTQRIHYLLLEILVDLLLKTLEECLWSLKVSGPLHSWDTVTQGSEYILEHTL